ncbi:MAG TPA: group 1 truncated hemoglobin [Acidimicrobiales bacterium]|nr:group 1 truncated hemoglobin [Acidimicrobiales bacterium]
MSDEQSLYERVGGAQVVDAMVGAFYERVFADAVLRPFFETVDKDKLLRMQEELFTAALGGPPATSPMHLREAHAGRGIEPRHLVLFTEHLVETLRDLDLPEDEADAVIGRIAVYADDVLGGGGEDG